MTADELAAVANSLRDLAERFRTRASYFAGDLDAANTFHLRATSAWHGERASTNLGIARDYFDAVTGMHDALLAVAGKFDAFATDADNIAGWLRPYEAVLAADEESVPGERQNAWFRRDQLMLDWVEACTTHAGAISTESEPLETAYAAALGEFMPPVVPSTTSLPILGAWATDIVDVYKLGLTPRQIATMYASDGFTLTGSIHVASADGNSWDEATYFFGEGQRGFYDGGGWITSSSGEEYPIAFPTVVTEDGTYTADTGPAPLGASNVSNLGGDDTGWHVVEIQSGVERFYPDLSPLEALATGLAGTTGLVGPVPPDSGLDFIYAPPSGGPPSFTSHPASLPQMSDVVWAPSSDDPLSYPAPDQIGPYLPAPPPGLRPLGPVTAPTALNVADLAPTVAGGIIAVSGMNNGTDQAYQVVFEENDDGRRRANITTYTLYYDDNQDVAIHAQHLSVNNGGELVAQTVSYGDPYGTAGQLLHSGDGPAVEPFQYDGTDWDPLDIGDTTIL